MNKYWQTGDMIYIGDPFGDAKELTQQEYETLLLEEHKVEVRAQRDALIHAVEWRISRHRDEVDLGIEPTEDIVPVLEYIQSLRDVPQQEGFPHNINWPILE